MQFCLKPMQSRQNRNVKVQYKKLFTLPQGCGTIILSTTEENNMKTENTVKITAEAFEDILFNPDLIVVQKEKTFEIGRAHV